MRTFMVFLATLVTSSIVSAQFVDSLFVTINQDTVHVWDMRAQENCASRYSITVTSLHDTVYVLQTDTVGPLVNCTCLFNLRASIVNLMSGTYAAVVQRAQLKKYHYAADTLILVGSVQFSVSSSNVLPYFSLSSYQSACNPLVVQRGDSKPPTAFALHQNFPNPFNPSTVIAYDVPVSGHIKVEVYDASGRRVALLVDRKHSPGTYSLTFEALPTFSSGVYYCRLTAGTFTQTLAMLFIK
jgi:hypothetical protein